ncbi:hypothetical protein QLL95_gp0038 [Cotonvirus japonicus]|uniref:Uncharacterized protein n=1 Tax=Cotonvirus japonicus TaxID=2811091 RepID=A0ABM7NQY2_9VIRU|nr:hypothetical protein QLL95_gp0038 [Cotonvirus japonicus]BCS82527.1 hypothetical protein [Cotonvirus japonicus]
MNKNNTNFLACMFKLPFHKNMILMDFGIEPISVDDQVVKSIVCGFLYNRHEKLSKLKRLDSLMYIDYRELELDHIYKHSSFLDCSVPLMEFLLECGYRRFHEFDDDGQTALFRIYLDRLTIREELIPELDEKIKLLKKYGAICPKNKYNHTPRDRGHHMYIKRLPYIKEYLKESELI